MASFKEAYIDLANMVSEAKQSSGLSEESLIDLLKTQLVYGQAPITRSIETPPGEYVGGDETEFTEDIDDDGEDGDDAANLIPFNN